MKSMTLPVEISGTEQPRAKRINQIIIFAATVYLLHSLLNYSVGQQRELLQVGEVVPSFSVGLANGGSLSEANIIGNPTMIFFFANWCPCSHESIKFIKETKKQYGSMGLSMIGIGIQDSSEHINEFIKTHELDFPVGIKGGDDAARGMGVKTTPTTLFFDKTGVLRHVTVGKIEEHKQIQDGINSIFPKEQFALAK